MKALHELTQEEYIKHLEGIILEECGSYRCEQCKRVDTSINYIEVEIINDSVRVCNTCYDAWNRAEKKAQEIAASDEKDYRAAKGRV